MVALFDVRLPVVVLDRSRNQNAQLLEPSEVRVLVRAWLGGRDSRPLVMREAHQGAQESASQSTNETNVE